LDANGVDMQPLGLAPPASELSRDPRNEALNHSRRLVDALFAPPHHSSLGEGATEECLDANAAAQILFRSELSPPRPFLPPLAKPLNLASGLMPSPSCLTGAFPAHKIEINSL
jgi:hypothetical protein